MVTICDRIRGEKKKNLRAAQHFWGLSSYDFFIQTVIVLLQWIHKWGQQNNKLKYQSCINASAKQDKKLFEIQSIVHGSYKDKKC